MRNRPRFVFDTNALVNVALLPKSVNKLALQKAEFLGDIVFYDKTLSELKAVLVRTKFDRYLSLKDRLDYFDKLEARYQVVTVISNFEDCRDKKDNKFLNLAFDSEAIAIVTGDKDLLALNPYKNIQILNASDFFNTFNTNPENPSN